MKSTKQKVLEEVTEVLKTMTEIEGVTITLECNPIENLALDSGHGIPFALEIEDRLSIVIPPEINPFVNDTPIPCARTVGEIVDLLIALSAKQDEAQK
ncbi:hypothetical protein [Desulfovibrio sp.]|uniref:hypothetical protein n=1 Tax=Desulfovibrio sp. TaxID=885 RepID=UPI0025C73444|nr:hypothetical protein [Desulfovibrio sp.]